MISGTKVRNEHFSIAVPKYIARIWPKFVILGGHHTLQHWLKNVEWGGGSENPDDKVKLTFHAQGGLRFKIWFKTQEGIVWRMF